MDTSSIDLPGSEIESIELRDGVLRVHFSRANITKTMTGSVERTRWWQAGDLVLEGAEAETEILPSPLVCAGGDVTENIYTYRDMIPMPLDSRGYARLKLAFQGTDRLFVATGTAVRLDMDGVAKYLGHIRPETDD